MVKETKETMTPLSETDSGRVAEAIAKAERKTSGEIVLILTPESASYYHIPFAWASLLALLVPWPLIDFTWWSVETIFLFQLVSFLFVLALTFPKNVRYLLVSRSTKARCAHRRAVEQFLVQNMHTTKSRTGVLLYVSLAECYAEIIADSAIDAKVEKGTWQTLIDVLTQTIAQGKLTDGLLCAVEEIGTHLTKNFPPGTSDPNELPNHLIILKAV